MVVVLLGLILVALLFPGFLRWLLSLIALLFVGAMLFGAAHAADHSPAMEAFAKCTEDKINHGTYSSDDDGKSAMRLALDCKPTWLASLDECMKDGTTDERCTYLSILTLQLTLKSVGR